MLSCPGDRVEECCSLGAEQRGKDPLECHRTASLSRLCCVEEFEGRRADWERSQGLGLLSAVDNHPHRGHHTSWTIGIWGEFAGWTCSASCQMPRTRAHDVGWNSVLEESEAASLDWAGVASEGETEAGAAFAEAVGAAPITGRVDSNSPELGEGPAPSATTESRSISSFLMQ